MVREQTREATQRWQRHWDRGPTRLRWDKVPLQVGDPAPVFQRQDSTGTMVAMEDLWKERPCLLIFWRHFGCSCGVDRAERLKTEIATFGEIGARVAIVGQGEPPRAAAYARKYGLHELTILCDPSTDVYRAYGLLEGQPSQILFDAPQSFLAHDHETGVAFCQTREAEGRPLVDNPWLLPGEFVVDRSGRIALAYRYNFCEDYPDARVLYTALRLCV